MIYFRLLLVKAQDDSNNIVIIELLSDKGFEYYLKRSGRKKSNL